ncbi:MAG TPA: hypothetical protein VKZ67_08565 [Natronosporangium sp.]|nr:hypothetical protein [Natronosporangium sp.]
MKSHSLDLLSLAFGLIFIAAAVLWLVTEVGSLPRASLLWIIPGGVMLIAIAGVGHALRSIRSHRDRDRKPVG